MEIHPLCKEVITAALAANCDPMAPPESQAQARWLLLGLSKLSLVPVMERLRDFTDKGNQPPILLTTVGIEIEDKLHKLMTQMGQPHFEPLTDYLFVTAVSRY